MYDRSGYYIIYNQHYAALFTFKKTKLEIGLQDKSGAQKMVSWYYDLIQKEKGAEKTFTYTGFPLQRIKVNSGPVALDLENRIEESKKKLITRKGGLLLKVAALFLSVALLIYLVLLPWLATAAANRFPLRYEKEIGNQLFNSMKGGFTIKEKETAYLNDFFRELNFASKYDVTITVVKGDVANAFALLGGHIVVYDKLLNGLTSYGELAALLAHEFTHIQNRHALRSSFQQASSRLFFSLLLGDADAIGAVLVANAAGLKNLSYSRSLESEADKKGVRLLVERGISCAGFIQLFQFLKKGANTEVSEWISSHPDLAKRSKAVQQNELCKGATVSDHATLHRLFLQLKTAH